VSLNDVLRRYRRRLGPRVAVGYLQGEPKAFFVGLKDPGKPPEILGRGDSFEEAFAQVKANHPERLGRFIAPRGGPPRERQDARQSIRVCKTKFHKGTPHFN
jgi:hypothetical protein